jgi:hypothetical protein
MALADDILVLAGPPDFSDPADNLASLEGLKGGKLRLVETTDGSTLAEYDLTHSPIHDGIAVARGRLYLTTDQGRVVCHADRRRQADCSLPKNDP